MKSPRRLIIYGVSTVLFIFAVFLFVPPNGKTIRSVFAGKKNRLQHEKSPYLRQHADNPVDWYPWGPEAFRRARELNRPIFLSIGYSTCHWCHVMEHESFEDPKVARLMNENFICVKVDREERPDIDSVYMEAARLLRGGGGWPLNLLLTPDKKPFFAATYIPRESRFNRPGMLELIPRLSKIWRTRRGDVLRTGESVQAFMRKESAGRSAKAPSMATLRLARKQLLRNHDSVNGGFGKRPKFPTPHNLVFLLRDYKRTGDVRSRRAVETTLDGMRRGGIYDHIGFGFHRYSTDAEWKLPHFEKMLYDQALLALLYTEAYQALGRRLYARTAEEILEYVLRDMRDPAGGFYSAEDADSEGREGKFYLWSTKELRDLLSAGDADRFIARFGMRDGGNFQDEATGRRTGENVLHLKKSPLPANEFQARRLKLYNFREKRKRPSRDDKILTDWNGLMISALARGARVLNKPAYAREARRAADFMLTSMSTGKNGSLLHRWWGGSAGIQAYLDDYAFLIQGLLDLYETDFRVEYLRGAIRLQADLDARFTDKKNGGYFFTASDGEQLMVRKKSIRDGARPSGNSVAMLNLLRLGRMTGDSKYEKTAANLSRAFSRRLREVPAAHTAAMTALDFALGPAREIVIVGRPDTADTKAMLRALRERYIPKKVVLMRSPGAAKELNRIAPFTRHQKTLGGKATVYVCKNFRCAYPTTDFKKMLDLLK